VIVQLLADSASDDGSGGVAAVFLVIVWIISFIAYWIPTAVAFFRGVPNKASVLVINLFLGWTIIGWVVALAMAVRSHQQYPPPYPNQYPDQRR
jgi:hypothetical protein